MRWQEPQTSCSLNMLLQRTNQSLGLMRWQEPQTSCSLNMLLQRTNQSLGFMRWQESQTSCSLNMLLQRTNQSLSLLSDVSHFLYFKECCVLFPFLFRVWWHTPCSFYSVVFCSLTFRELCLTPPLFREQCLPPTIFRERCLTLPSI